MYSIQEQFGTDVLAQINNRVQDAQLIAGNVFDLGREIGVLNVRTSRASAEQLVGNVGKLLAATNPGEFFQIAASTMQPDLTLWTSYIEQLSNIAGRAMPLKTSLAVSAGKLLAPLAAPTVTWPKADASTGQPLAQAASAVEAPAIAENTQLEAAMAAAPAVPPPAAVPYAAALDDSSEEAPQAAAAPPAETVEAIREVAESMTGVNRAPPAVMAASALPPEAPPVPEITVVHKPVARAARKPVTPPPAKKSGPAGRGAASRGRKA